MIVGNMVFDFSETVSQITEQNNLSKITKISTVAISPILDLIAVGITDGKIHFLNIRTN